MSRTERGKGGQMFSASLAGVYNEKLQMSGEVVTEKLEFAIFDPHESMARWFMCVED